MPPLAAIQTLLGDLDKSLIGRSQLAKRLIIALICNGNLLLEGFPGTAKTRAVRALAQLVDGSLGRIQFTSDLLPSDVTGTEAYHHEQNQEKLVFQPGPIFHNLILADEINRAPAKVQAALLEAMEERQVTVAGKTYPLPELFMVLATQNPIEQEGTYPLPEAQMDRFLMKVIIDYPDDESERDIIRMVRNEERQEDSQTAVIAQADIFAARAAQRNIFVSEAVENYIVALVMATRHPERISAQMKNWVAVGASPRASIALDRCSRCHAWLDGREYVEPEDVRAVARDVLRHRIAPAYEAIAEGVNGDDIIDQMLNHIAVP